MSPIRSTPKTPSAPREILRRSAFSTQMSNGPFDFPFDIPFDICCRHKKVPVRHTV